MDKNHLFSIKKTILCKGQLISLEKPMIMGILNITPDSFYDGNTLNSEKEIHERIEKMISNGADIIDVGAVSTRPGAKEVQVDEELTRLKKVLPIFYKNYPYFKFSLDTFRASVAQWAVEEYGACMINDISAGDRDSQMIETVAKLKVPYIMMHTRGNSADMQQLTDYDDLINDIIQYFNGKLIACKEAGMVDCIIDPGFGFAKTLDQNYEIIKNLDLFHILESPILVGVSRKSMIYKLLETSPENALTGTIALNMLALQKGASMLRVHDVKDAVETLKIFNKCK